MHTQIPEYPDYVMQFIKQTQRNKLTGYYGPLFERDLSTIFPSRGDFLSYISSAIENEFENNSDERYELEARMQNKVFDDVPNVTQYEFMQHKAILNETEILYRKIVDEKLASKIPYNATLYSLAKDAVIIKNAEWDKSIIFFHSELFGANLMFCKLIITLISAPLSIVESYADFKLKKDQETLNIVKANAIDFYKYYLTNESEDIPYYDLKTPQENNMLAIFLDGIMLFIYSHECGHEYFNHFAHDETKSIEQLWADEYQADLFAMDIMGRYISKMNKEILSLIAPIIFFRYIILLENYSPVLDFQDTHPPTNSRLNLYLHWLKTVIHPRDHENLRIFLSFEQELSDCITEIFNDIHKL